MRKLFVAGALGGALLSTAHAGSGAASTSEVTIENFTFKPATLSVRTGTVVTFKNADDIPHSIVASDGSFHSKALDTGDTYTITVAKPGDTTYFCGLHPHMQGYIVVAP